MKVAGSGALNLDLIYEIPDLEILDTGSLSLEPGHETWGSYEDARVLLKELDKKARLMAKSGGGSAANTLCALSRLGLDSMFIGSVGEDEEGSFILESMEEVDCSLVSRKGASSLCIIVMEEKSRDRAMFVAPGSIHVDTTDPKLREKLAGSHILHMTSLVQEEGIKIQEQLADLTNSRALISFDPGEIYAARGKYTLENLLSRTDLLLSTDYEMTQLFGKTSEQDIISMYLGTRNKKAILKDIKFFQELSAPVIVKKMGSKGAVIYSRNGNYFCAAKKVDKIVDNTGAGDAFNAGIIYAISR
ncbi:MAG: hypothetical protein DSZ23_02375, partial [Thermodesulfatator sp.]